MSEVGFLPDFFARRLSLSFVPPFDGLMIAREDWFVIKLVVEFGLIIHLPGCVTFRGGLKKHGHGTPCYHFRVFRLYTQVIS